MGTRHANGIRLYSEEHGSGAPILCFHAAGGTALASAGAIDAALLDSLTAAQRTPRPPT